MEDKGKENRAGGAMVVDIAKLKNGEHKRMRPWSASLRYAGKRDSRL